MRGLNAEVTRLNDLCASLKVQLLEKNTALEKSEEYAKWARAELAKINNTLTNAIAAAQGWQERVTMLERELINLQREFEVAQSCLRSVNLRDHNRSSDITQLILIANTHESTIGRLNSKMTELENAAVQAQQLAANLQNENTILTADILALRTRNKELSDENKDLRDENPAVRAEARALANVAELLANLGISKTTSSPNSPASPAASTPKIPLSPAKMPGPFAL